MTTVQQLLLIMRQTHYHSWHDVATWILLNRTPSDGELYPCTLKFRHFTVSHKHEEMETTHTSVDRCSDSVLISSDSDQAAIVSLNIIHSGNTPIPFPRQGRYRRPTYSPDISNLAETVFSDLLKMLFSPTTWRDFKNCQFGAFLYECAEWKDWIANPSALSPSNNVVAKWWGKTAFHPSPILPNGSHRICPHNFSGYLR